MEIINIDEFEKKAKSWIGAFCLNKKILEGYKLQERTEEEWMELFLKWLEWGTDMHEEYWK